MKHQIVRVLGIIMCFAVCALGFFGCDGTFSIRTKDVVATFYDSLAECDFDTTMSVINPSYIKSFGENDELKQQLQSFRVLNGKNQSYDIVDMTQEGGVKRYTISVTYEGRIETETIAVSTDKDGKETIVEIDLAYPVYIEKMAEEFFRAYQMADFQSIFEYLHPRYYDFATEKDLQTALMQIEGKAGNYQNYLLKEQKFYYMEDSELPTTIYSGLFIVKFEKISLYFQIQICEEDNVVGINYIRFDFLEDTTN